MVPSSRHLVDTTLNQVSSLSIRCNSHMHMQIPTDPWKAKKTGNSKEK